MRFLGTLSQFLTASLHNSWQRFLGVHIHSPPLIRQSLLEASTAAAAVAAVSAAAVPERGREGGDDEEEEQRRGDPDDGRHGDRVQHGHADAAEWVEG